MANSYFQFKQFIVQQDRCAMKVTTDGCLFGAWVAERMKSFSELTPSRMLRDAKEAQGALKNPLRSLAYPLRADEIGIAFQKLLDIGTGTGLLALMVAQKNNIHIDAIEIDSLAAQQAKENFASSPWKDRINIINQDVLEFKPEHRYEVIVSNPPFYENELFGPKQEKNIAHHSGGLLLADLFKVIKRKLNDNGKFFLLLPYKRHAEIKMLLEKEELFTHEKVLVRATAKHQPTRIMVMGGKEKSENEKESVMNIKNGEEYSGEFISLLKDYYLHL
ncbi:MAG: tRNA1(Val) (adenine(37)-N6)-methyltransferase [Flavisolibacter sp.]|jgi:tRNA1Val (adenine37-N6)-methyltransferase